MSESPDPRLERAAESVADDESPDWEGLEADAPQLAGRLRALRALGRLAGSHRDARADLAASRLAATDLADSQERVAALEQATPVFRWGFLRALERIGEGGFGEVWRAYDPTLHREVALKLRRLPREQAGVPDLAATMDPRARLWLSEARRLASVRHPHVLTVFGAAVHDGRAGMWTELVRGETLEQRLVRTGPLSARELASIGADLCGALAAVHGAGLVHGDVKPDNVMLEPAGGAGARPRLVLMDFGAAHERTARERLGVLTAGTPLVMAPELLEGAEPSVASDVYAAGVLLHRLATGRWPLEATSLDELRARHARGERVPLARERPALPRALARAVDRATAPRVTDRFASAEEFRRALLPLVSPGRAWLARAAAGAVVVAVVALAFAAWTVSHKPSTETVVPPSKLRPATGPAPVVAGPVLVGSQRGGYLGNCAAAIGDLDGDGIADLAVGELGYGDSLARRGRVLILRGTAAGLDTAAAWTLRGGEADEAFGAFVAAAGDVDGDGFDDLLVLSRWVRPGEHEVSGRVYLYRGSRQGPVSPPVWVLEGDQPGAYLGDGVTGVGDVNGDGFDDLVVGCATCLRDADQEGRLALYLGSRAGLTREPARVWWGGSPEANLGWRVARVGDMNGDGFDDVVLAASHWSGRLGREGRVQMDFGGPRGPDGIADWSVTGDQRDASLGWSVGGGGDADGDGVHDLVVAQLYWSGRWTQQGRLLLYRGARGTPPTRAAWRLEGSGAFGGLGQGSVGIARDLDGDRRDEVFASTPNYSRAPDSLRVGMLVVASLERGGRRARSVWRVLGTDPNVPIGWWAAGAGDVNHDGLGDLLLDQPNWPANGEARGKLMVYYGRRAAAAATTGPGALRR